LHSADLKEQRAPSDMLVVACCVLIMLSVLLAPLEVMGSPYTAARVLLMAFLFASAILFIYIWNKIPKSFLISQTDTQGWLNSYAEDSDSTKHSFLFQAWQPIIQSFFLGPLLYWIWIPLLLLSIFAWHFSIFFIIAIWVAMAWSMTHERIAWIVTFPISRSIVLLLILAPLFLSIVAGYSIGIFIKSIHHGLMYPMRILLIHIGLMTAISLIVMDCMEIGKWRRVRHFNRVFKCAFIALWMGAFLAAIVFPGFRSAANDFANSLPLYILRVLPDNWPAAMAAAAASLTGLYWITDRLYREAEFSNAPVEKE